jgi:hypothetical protein
MPQIVEGDFVKLKHHAWLVGKVQKKEIATSDSYTESRSSYFKKGSRLCYLTFDKAFAPGALKGDFVADIREPFELDSVVKITRAEHDFAVSVFAEKQGLRSAALRGDAESWRALGASSVAAFRPLMERVSCPYARSSQLLGSPEWDWALTADMNILHCVPNLRRLADANKSVEEPPERVDGLVMEVPIRSLSPGIPSSALTEAAVAAAGRRTQCGFVDLAGSQGMKTRERRIAPSMILAL